LKKQKYDKLPPKFKAKWVEALRSGDYKQATHQLYSITGDSYCCLGVACRVAEIDSSHLKNSTRPGNLNGNFRRRLPKALLQNFDSPTIAKLVDMNDSKHKSFNTIANWIEKYL